MNFKKIYPLVELISLAILIYIGHKSVFLFLEDYPKLQGFYYSIEIIYGFFFICSLLIILVLMKVNSKNIDNVGYTFLWLTCIKMGLSYTLLGPIMNAANSNLKTEKINFFIIFALFLTIETIVTVRILNKKQ